MLRPLSFSTFDFDMCFAPQRRALFRHANFKKCSQPGVACTFWLRNVLCARTACAFSTSQLPKVVRDRQFLTLLSSKCAPRHNGAHFPDISTSKSAPKPRCFDVLCAFWLRNVLRATAVCNFSSLICPDGSAPAALASLLFNLPEPQMTNHWKNTANRLSLPFRAPASSFFSLFLFSGLLSSSLLLSDSSTSAFPSVHIVGSLTSKLPYRCGKPMLSHPKMLPKNGHLDSPGHLSPSIHLLEDHPICWLVSLTSDLWCHWLWGNFARSHAFPMKTAVFPAFFVPSKWHFRDRNQNGKYFYFWLEMISIFYHQNMMPLLSGNQTWQWNIWLSHQNLHL